MGYVTFEEKYFMWSDTMAEIPKSMYDTYVDSSPTFVFSDKVFNLQNAIISGLASLGLLLIIFSFVKQRREDN